MAQFLSKLLLWISTNDLAAHKFMKLSQKISECYSKFSILVLQGRLSSWIEGLTDSLWIHRCSNRLLNAKIINCTLWFINLNNIIPQYHSFLERIIINFFQKSKNSEFLIKYYELLLINLFLNPSKMLGKSVPEFREKFRPKVVT